MGVLSGNSLSSGFFENISSAGAIFQPKHEGFESERFIQFRAGTARGFGRRHAQIRKKTISHALALSTAIFVVSVHRKDEPWARRTSQKGGRDGTRQNRGGRSRAFRYAWDNLQARQRVCSGLSLETDSACLAERLRQDGHRGVPARHRAGKTKERITAT
jgi:hypothetical protein